MDILNKITKLRIDRDWSLFKLAEESGLSQSTLANMFSRKTNPSITTLKALCDAFNISLSEFFAENQSELIYIKNSKIYSMVESLTLDEKNAIINLINAFKNHEEKK